MQLSLEEVEAALTESFRRMDSGDQSDIKLTHAMAGMILSSECLGAAVQGVAESLAGADPPLRSTGLVGFGMMLIIRMVEARQERAKHDVH